MNIELALDYLEQSLMELDLHFTDEDFLNMGLEVRYAPREYGAILQLWLANVPSSHSQEVLWDSLSVNYEDKKIFQALLATIVEMGFQLSTNQISKVQETITDIPMYEFHPQRFRAIMPFAKQLGQMAINGEVPMFTMEALQYAMNQFMHDYNNKLHTTPLRFRNSNHRTITQTVQAAMFYGGFVEQGRQIFDFPTSLVESFRKSDVEDIPLEAINLPYESFYLHFGAQEDLEMAPGWHPDGAYVSRQGDVKGDYVIQFCLTTINKDQLKYESWTTHHEPIYIQGVESSLMGIGVGEAVDHVLSAKIAELNKQINNSMQKEIDQALKEFNEATESELYKEIVDVSRKNAQRELDELPQKHKVWREILNLVVNSIAYLTSYRDDTKTEWPKKAPKNLIISSLEGAPKHKQRARSKLAALGYTPIHICGTKFVEMVEDLTSGTGIQRKPTWVRGSWVWQPHGPQHTLRRLQWRMPHVRNKDNNIEEDSLGHLYLVS